MSSTVEFKEDTVIVVFGASGDLAKKKTFPALFGLFREGLLSSSTRIIGYARSKLTDEELKTRIKPNFKTPTEKSKAQVDEFLKMVTYISGPYDSPEGFQKLNSTIEEYDAASKVKESHRLFYLALPPSVFTTVAANLKQYVHPGDKGIARIVIEKPFGHDLASAQALQKELAPLWSEDELYRIDHYLGKEMVKNLVPFRFANNFLSACWNNNFIKSIQISFKEPFGTEGRGGYFDSIGIIRDVMQNHLFQVLTLVMMERPVSFDAEAVRDEKVRLLKSIKPFDKDNVLVGQYTRSEDGSKPGYLDDETVKPDSKCVTFACLTLQVDNERWQGVPVILRAGKALNEGKVEIRVQFRENSNGMFKDINRNELVIRIQPDEAMYMKMNTKVPGISNGIAVTELDLSYKSRYSDFYIPEAYESLIRDCLRGDHSNFVRDDELDISWGLFTPLLNYLEGPDAPTPQPYAYGSRGPAGLTEYLKKNGYVFQNRKIYQWPVTTPDVLEQSKI
ncbi:hypothetical protein KL921_004331 [Ogataea angusta]|uniref:Glucose-6-phosphate 1-dehydrogenase n=1 Tax=Pichia angusta TaxID=870730 RepID=A0AAN6DDM1_PICAN|nr:uncharacterized protein KL928_004621 [Ogataea angusta]KAG7807573.1 hypothetical protein KL921_004331 [Ogataea angusta]KAG7816579.1 hypothetical protein KL928_004621 [Ogataea angusta]KAG7822998.1 hypothetical protein KL909_003601 [Ogataea angusta]KAG7828168.1 hypothetical protein KL920_003895 [Ogataea angusta]KAG7837830.1 hypothetical protein KL942_004242 [Ogataea angusta]